MDFRSPRFAGNALLEQILSDPDTGAVKLGPGSPADSVQPVQQALVDLGWPFRVVPPILTDPFADGVFGNDTNTTVLTYKRQYDIHFPPTAPTGLIDGFVGPRTMFRLDVHIAFFDESVAAIDAKIASLQAAGVNVTPDPVGGDVSVIVRGHFSVMRFVLIDGAQGAIFNTFEVGTFEVHGNLFSAYMPRQDALGMPTSDEHDGPPGARESDFVLGVLRCDLETGAVAQISVAGDPPPTF